MIFDSIRNYFKRKNSCRVEAVDTIETSHLIPELLEKLVREKIWPDNKISVNVQEDSPLIGIEIVKQISPDDRKLILMIPPFHTIQDEINDGHKFWTSELSNVGEIDYSNALIIADFGIGSDSVVILYLDEALEPCVKYLKWSGMGQNVTHTWEHVDDNFRNFAIRIGLISSDV